MNRANTLTNLREHVVKHEGWRDSVYFDVKQDAIGFGFDLDNPTIKASLQEKGYNIESLRRDETSLRRADGEEVLDTVLDLSMDEASNLSKNWDSLPEEVQVGLTDLVYNVGATSANKFVNMKAELAKENPDFNVVADHLMDSLYGRGEVTLEDGTTRVLEGARKRAEEVAEMIRGASAKKFQGLLGGDSDSATSSPFDQPIELVDFDTDLPYEDSDAFEYTPKGKPVGRLTKANDDYHKDSLKATIEADTGQPAPVDATLDELAAIDRDLEVQAAVELAVDPSEPEIEAYTGIAELVLEEENEPYSGYMPYARNLFYSDEELTRKSAVNQLIRQDLIALYEDIDGWEHFESIAKAFIPGEYSKEMYTTFGTMFAEDTIYNLIQDFQATPAEEQLFKYKLIKKVLIESDIERPEVAAILEAMSSPLPPDTFGFSDWWAAFDLVELTTIAPSLIRGTAKFVKGTSALREMSKSNKLAVKKRATELAAKAAKDKDVAASQGVTQGSVADGLQGLDTAEDLSSLSLEAQARHSLLYDEVDELAEQLTKNDTFVGGEFLTPTDKGLAVRKAEEIIIPKIEDFMKERGVVVKTKVETFGDRVDFRMSYSRDGENISEVFTYGFSKDDVGGLKLLEDTKIDQQLRSPLGAFKGEFRTIAEDAIRLEDTTRAVVDDLEKTMVKALNPIKGVFKRTGASIKRINQVLRKGDAYTNPNGENVGKVFTPSELRNGVEGVHLSEREIETYYNLRRVYDARLKINNGVARKNLKREGFTQEININGSRHFIHEMTELKDAQRLLPSDIEKAYFPNTDSVVNLTGQSSLKDWYKHGYRLGRLSTPASGGKSGKFDFVIMRGTEDLKPLDNLVIDARVGWVDRIAKNRLYYVKRSRAGSRNSNRYKAFSSDSSIKTLHAFNTRDEAHDYLKTVKGEDGDEFRVTFDRELEGEGIALDHSSRSSDGVYFGADSDLMPVLDPIHGAALGMKKTASIVTKSEWSLFKKDEWLKTARLAFPEANIESFSAGLPKNLSGGKAVQLNRLHDEIQGWSGVNTFEETYLSKALQNVYERAYGRGKVANAIASSARALGGVQVDKQMRSLAFHSLLGWFNPMQIWVQAQGAAVALGVNPLHSIKSLRMQTVLSMVEHSKNADVIKQTAKITGIAEKELLEVHSLYNKSGLGKSIRANADIVNAEQGSISGISALFDKGLMLYRIGEGFNRRFSFSQAYFAWKSANKGKEITDEALKSIISRANNTMLNLNAANRASWQKGGLGVALQFKQVSVKAWDAMMPKLVGGGSNFSPREKAGIFMAQLGLYGSAAAGGIPFAGAALHWAAELAGYTQEDIDNMTEEEIAMFNGGIQGWMLSSIFGTEFNVGTRGALSDEFQGFFESYIFGDKKLKDTLFGASGTVFQRLGNAMEKLAVIGAPMRDENFSLDADAIANGATALFAITGTGRNLERVMQMHMNGMLLNSRQNPTVQRKFSALEQVAVGFGFKLQAEENDRSLRTIQRKRKEGVQATQDLMKELAVQYLSNPTNMEDSEKAAKFVAARDFLLENEDLLPDERERLVKASEKFIDSLITGEGIASENLRKFLSEIAELYGDSIQGWSNAQLIQVNK